MKKISLIVILLFSYFTLQSQGTNYDLKQTEKLKDKLLERNVGFKEIGKNKNHYYYLFMPFKYVFNLNSIGSNRIPYIGMYDHDMNLIKKVKTNIISDGKERDYRGIVYLNDKIYLITSFQNADHKKHYFFVQTINTTTLEDNNDLRKIGEIDYSKFSKYNDTNFEIVLSDDKSKVLVYTNIINKKNEILNSEIYVFNNSFNLNWSKKDIAQGFTSGMFIAKQIKIDNAGNVYVAGIKYDKLKVDAYLEFKKDATYFPKNSIYNYAIFHYYNKGKNSKNAIFKLPKKFIRELTIIPVGNNKVLCAGIYSKPGMISPQGFFTYKYDVLKNTNTSVQLKEFKKDFIETGFDEKTIKKFKKKAKNESEWEPFNYSCNLLKSKQGGYICIAERNLDGVKTSRSGNVITTYPVYHYHDLLVFNILANGQIKRMDVVNKRQYTINLDWYSSYNFTEYNGNLYFVFTEFIKHETLFKETKPTDLVLVKIDKAGKQTREVLRTFPRKLKEEPFMRKNTGIRISDNELVYALITMNFKYYNFNKLILK